MAVDRTAWKYPVQLVITVSTEVGDLIDTLAMREELKKTEVIRSLLHAGIRKAGYGDVIRPDKRIDRDADQLGPGAAESTTPGP